MSPETRFGMSGRFERDLEPFTRPDRASCLDRVKRFEQHVREQSPSDLRNLYGLKGLNGEHCRSPGQYSTQEIRALSQKVRLVFMDSAGAPTAYWVAAFRKDNNGDYRRACQRAKSMWETPPEGRPKIRG